MSPDKPRLFTWAARLWSYAPRGVEVRVDMNDDLIFGIRDFLGRDGYVALSRADRRQHVQVIGKSGCGKSLLLENLAIQDIENGHGLAFFDPHGDSALKLLDCIPRHRIEDVVYLDPSDLEHPIGINLLGQVYPDRRHLVASGVVSVFKGLFPEFFGPRMEYIFHAAVSALLDCQNVSLLSLQRMLSDERYRSWVVRQVKDPVVQMFWEREFEAHDRKTQAEMVSPILNKVGQMLMSPVLRNILGQVTSSIDARFMMDNGRILIVNLAKGKLGPEKANLLGALLITQFQLAAMSRADVPHAERRDFFLYVDEFQSLVTDSFASMLSEIRKYGVGLVLCSQFMRQLRPQISDALTGNVGSIIAFRVGHDDADVLQRAFGNAYAADSFTSLSNGEVYAKVLSAGRNMEPFLARTLPPEEPRHRRSETIMRRSRERYARPRARIEGKIARWIRNCH